MESLLVILALLLVLLVALGELRKEKLKNRQIEPLKNAIKKAEADAIQKDIDKLSNGDIDVVVGFLNRMRKEDPGPN